MQSTERANPYPKGRGRVSKWERKREQEKEPRKLTQDFHNKSDHGENFAWPSLRSNTTDLTKALHYKNSNLKSHRAVTYPKFKSDSMKDLHNKSDHDKNFHYTLISQCSNLSLVHNSEAKRSCIKATITCTQAVHDAFHTGFYALLCLTDPCCWSSLFPWFTLDAADWSSGRSCWHITVNPH